MKPRDADQPWVTPMLSAPVEGASSWKPNVAGAWASLRDALPGTHAQWEGALESTAGGGAWGWIPVPWSFRYEEPMAARVAGVRTERFLLAKYSLWTYLWHLLELELSKPKDESAPLSLEGAIDEDRVNGKKSSLLRLGKDRTLPGDLESKPKKGETAGFRSAFDHLAELAVGSYRDAVQVLDFAKQHARCEKSTEQLIDFLANKATTRFAWGTDKPPPGVGGAPDLYVEGLRSTCHSQVNGVPR